MEELIFKITILLTFAIFFIPKKLHFYTILIIQCIIITISSWWAANTLFFNSAELKINFFNFFSNDLFLFIDNLTAFYIFVINFTCFTGLIFSKGYLEPLIKRKSKADISFHYFNFIWLHISMLLVVMLRDGLAFLFVWELMSLSSFFLVIFEHEKKETLKSGLKYLLQMHIGMVFIFIAFILVYVQTNNEISFDNLNFYFTTNEPFLIFILFFIGFAIKAGFIPLHTWLPHAHPAAPSHVSGVMSGVMIKIGIYGILRVLTYIHHDLFNIGLFVLFISLISGVLGVSIAIVQHDIKKLLAYHSIENIGIIGIGIGLGVLGLSEKIPVLTVLGFGGGILHILNHSLFKSILFYTAGSVYKQTKTKNIELMGGLIKLMPFTAVFFLLGSMAICGLPLLNGFVSEFLIYSGMLKSFHPGNLFIDVILLFSLSGLVIIGGLSFFCFSKVFSIIFLGSPRSNSAKNSEEVGISMIIPYILTGIPIIIIGLFPGLIINPLASIIGIYTNETTILYDLSDIMNNISLISGIFLVLICILWMIRAFQQKDKSIKQVNTWSCGYTGANPALHQYTATSYADNFGNLANQVVNLKKKYKNFDEIEIFPGDRIFETHSSDIFEDNLVLKPSRKILFWMERSAVFQTGKIQHYLLYALVFLLAIFVLSMLNWI